MLQTFWKFYDIQTFLSGLFSGTVKEAPAPHSHEEEGRRGAFQEHQQQSNLPLTLLQTK